MSAVTTCRLILRVEEIKDDAGAYSRRKDGVYLAYEMDRWRLRRFPS